MNAIAKIDMSAVMRLTRGGRLGEATALIQRGLRGGVQDSSSGSSKPTAILELERSNEGEWRSADDRPLVQTVPRFERRTVRNAAGILSYKLFVPSTRTKANAPLVVMLHGCTQTADDFAVGTRMNELAQQHGFLVAYPEQTRAANASRCWNWFKSGDQIREQGEPSMIAAAIRSVIEEFQIDPTRVFVAGLSAGGAAAAIMGCAYPDLFAGAGVHSGLACGAASDMYSAFAAMRGGARLTSDIESRVRTIVFHSTGDRTVNAKNAEVVAMQASGLSTEQIVERGRCADGTSYTRTISTDCKGATTGETWLIDGGGHAWSGGNPAGSYATARGPDASREMLRFFGISGA